MMSDEELDDLAADITERGLLHPVVLTTNSDGKTIGLDGRNRYEACRRAGVAPTTTVYDGDDPVGFVFAENVNRRHMTKGSQAMAVVKAESFNLKERGAAAEFARTAGLNAGRLSQARGIADFAPDLVDRVIAGATPLDAAYKVAQDRKKDADSAETNLAWLQEHHPKFAAMVAEEELTLAEALAAARKRDEAVASARKLFVGNLTAGVADVLKALGGREVEDTVRFYVDPDTPTPTPADCRAAADALIEAADVLETLAKETR